MKVLLFSDNKSLSEFAAAEIIDLIKRKPKAVLCLASGDSPKLTCELFVKKAKEENADLSQIMFIGLDEWVGLSPEIAGSCQHDFSNRIFEPLGFTSTQYHLFNGLSDDLENECALMDKIIREKGGIDLMIVGIGMNGHIGFNEPGTDFHLLSHVVDLDETTITVGQKYFKQPVSLQKGITLGLGHLMAAKKVFLIANGIGKAPVIQKAVEETVNTAFPATIMQLHSNGFILIDSTAGSLLDKTKIN